MQLCATVTHIHTCTEFCHNEVQNDLTHNEHSIVNIPQTMKTAPDQKKKKCQHTFGYMVSICTYRTADVANTWPLEPTDSTIIEATTTMRSVLTKDKGL